MDAKREVGHKLGTVKVIQIRKLLKTGEPGGARTRDHRIKSAMLYQLSYRPVLLTETRRVQTYNSGQTRAVSCGRRSSDQGSLHTKLASSSMLPEPLYLAT